MFRSRYLTILVLLLAVMLLALPGSASATDADLDPAFGTNGVATLMAGDPGSRALALDIQDDGKIVVTGEAQLGNLIVTRFNADGSLDTDFADAGVFTSDLIRRGEDVDAVSGGKILATGSNDDHVLKLNSDGTPDQSFSADGVSGSQFFNPDDQSETEKPNMARVLPWPGDHVLVTGTVDYGPYFFTFARYNPDGTLDDTFGDDGQVQTDFTPPDDGLDQEPLALASYPGDRFVTAGYRDITDDVPTSSVVARYLSNGELDDSFGDDGKTTNDFFASNEYIKEVFTLPDGRILAIGDGLVDPGNFGQFQETLFIARYDADGTLNDGFGTNGVRIHDEPGSQEVRGAALMDDGSIIIVGTQDDTGSQAFVARFDAEGNPDPEFGQDGWAFFGTEAPGAQFQDVTIDENGDILIAGSVQAADGLRAAVFKLGSTPAGVSRTWGDNNCSGDADPVDSLLTLRFDAGLPTNTGDCPALGDSVDVSIAELRVWGDLDCSGEVNPVDSLKLLRFDAGLEVAQPAGCPEPGAEVTVAAQGS